MLNRIAVCFVCLIALACPAMAQKRVALVIGNAAYKETAPLTNTRNDAADMVGVLKRLGFSVLDGIDLDKRSMERIIRQFDQQLEGAEIALFFYAGHGIQVAGQNHLVPVDARLAAEGDIEFESLPLNLVLSRMERTAKISLVLLDACRDNPLARNLARTMGTRAVNIGQGLAEVKTGVGTMISFSTQPGNVALDGQGRNSPYTTALLAEIELPGRDVISTLAAVRGQVVKATQGKQVPWEHTSLLGQVVLKAGGAVPVVQSTPQPAPQAPGNSAAAEAWPLVKDTTSVAALDAFVRRFGDTFYGDLARARLGELNKAKPAPPTQPTIALPSATRSPDASCGAVLAFLKDTGAFGSKPVREAAYADRVAYYKKGEIGRSEVISTIRNYERQFSTRIYEVDDKTLVVRGLADSTCHVRFEYNYSRKNNVEEQYGRRWSEFTVRRLSDRFEIVAETGDAITRSVRSLR